MTERRQELVPGDLVRARDIDVDIMARPRFMHQEERGSWRVRPDALGTIVAVLAWEPDDFGSPYETFVFWEDNTLGWVIAWYLRRT